MKYILALAMFALLGFTLFAGWNMNWLMSCIGFVLTLVLGFVVVGIYAIEDVKRNKPPEDTD